MSVNQSFYDQAFTALDTIQNPLKKGIYEECLFRGCNFEKSDFIKFKFINCRFENCNLSLVRLDGTTLNSVYFVDCKMIGIHFEASHDFGRSFTFKHCQLNYCSFYGMKIPATLFEICQLQEVDWSSAVLTDSRFEGCDLLSAKFENTHLANVDFRTAYNFSIDPETNHLVGAYFELDGLPGLLVKYRLNIERY